MWRILLIIITFAASLLGYHNFFASISPYLPKFKVESPINNQANPDNFSDTIPNNQSSLNFSNYIGDTDTIPFKIWVTQQGYDLKPEVLEKIDIILNYVDANKIEYNHIVTLIDYSLPANQKRLWVFDLDAKKILFYTYVAHGLKSGKLESRFFSNRFDSKASSIGVFRTHKTYYGRHGLSLRLDGLERGFNDNADSRAIVMHGGWYVEEGFIQKYGRAGRSWGCPAVPKQITKDIINTIKDNSLLIVYYPNPTWFEKSRFFKRDDELLPTRLTSAPFNQPSIEAEEREEVLLAQIAKKNKNIETEAILAIPADRYSSLFQNKVPLERMLRRQIDHVEYIALSKNEFDYLLNIFPQNNQTLQDLSLILPKVVMVRGYYATEMHKIDYGFVTNVQVNPASIPITACNDYTVYFSNHSPLSLRPTNRFIRWLGL